MSVIYIHHYRDEAGTEWFSKYAAREILGVTKNTLKSYLRALFGELPAYLPTSTLEVLCQMQIWLQVGNGRRKHSKDGFAMRLRTKTLDREFRRLYIPLELHLTHLQAKINSAKQTYGYQNLQTSACITVRATAVA